MTIELTTDVHQGGEHGPVGYLVHVFKDNEYKHKLFGELKAAKKEAMLQAEGCDTESWPIYPLYAGKKLEGT